MSKKLSGAEFRKKAREREKRNEEFLSKVPKISGFFRSGDKQLSYPVESESATANSANESNVSDSVSQNLDYVPVVEDEGVVVSGKVANSDNLQSQSENSELEHQTEINISNDPALWNIDDKTREHIVKNGFKQNVDADFSLSERIYGVKKRWCTKGYFEKHHKNGEIKTRDWLVYSPSKASVFCAYCRLFGNDAAATSSFCEGFNDWKNAAAALQSHENSPAHRSSVLSYVSRAKVENRIDNKLVQAWESDVKYWREVLKRVVATIKYLATRGYPFRGSDNLFGSSRNGAYIGALELLAQFDPFLSQHIQKHANKGQGSTSYLSHFTCDEIIIIMGHTVLKRIIKELMEAKYYSLIVDSTPDIAHVDQLTLVVRYVLPNGINTTPVERFLEFLPNTGHKAEELATALFKSLGCHGIVIKDCRGQSFDNASNMAGVYTGLQARIKEQCPLAEYIPCSSHSLNLVGVASAEASDTAVVFFDLVQGLYNFFGASTHRWEILKSVLKDRFPVVKSLSVTRWSARADALKAIYKSFPEILNALENIINNENEKPTTRQEARGLEKNLLKLENAFLLVFWKDVMEKFWKVNATLQSETVDLGTVASLFESLQSYVQQLRDKFEDYASAAEMLTKSNNWGASRVKKRKRFFDEMPSSNETTELDRKETFRINVFLLIVDRIATELDKRANAYKGVHHKFGFLLNLRTLEDNAIKSKSKDLVELYKDDLEECFSDECVQFKYFLKSENAEDGKEREDEKETKKKRPSFKPLLQLIYDKNLQNIFPNMEIVLRIVLSTAVTNCSGERSFSVLKRVKNHLRNSLSQCKLNALSIMAIESDLTESIDFEEVTRIFVESKQRRKLP